MLTGIEVSDTLYSVIDGYEVKYPESEGEL
jgi:hypothetical protein